MASAAFKERLDRVKVEGGVMNVGIDLGVAISIAVGRDMAIDSCQKVKTAMGGLPMTMKDWPAAPSESVLHGEEIGGYQIPSIWFDKQIGM